MLTFFAARAGYRIGPPPGLAGHCCANVSARRLLKTKRENIAELNRPLSTFLGQQVCFAFF